ncbi:MAG: WYL domain-containing protein [Saprospiraceae bacterium]|nr:WYL domain-containing protein [Saprospiraceae bacterium]
MNRFKDHSPKTRLLKILRDIIERPHGYTKKQLAIRYNVHEDTIKKDFDEMRNAGFDILYDPQYRYALKQDEPFDQLRESMFFSELDQQLLDEALLKINSDPKRIDRIRNKIANLYDLSTLGSNLITKTYLSKINLLEKAKKFKKVVTLCDYRSTNSSQVSDRRVEAFHISPKEDIIQAFDLDHSALRHYRISRITRIEITPSIWKHAGKHYVVATDPFGLVDDHQVSVHIRLRVGGYNELLERFPATQAYIHASASAEDIYELECKVNHRFYGLSNFLLGYHEHVVDILEPETLRLHIKKSSSRIDFS